MCHDDNLPRRERDEQHLRATGYSMGILSSWNVEIGASCQDRTERLAVPLGHPYRKTYHIGG